MPGPLWQSAFSVIERSARTFVLRLNEAADAVYHGFADERVSNPSVHIEGHSRVPILCLARELLELVVSVSNGHDGEAIIWTDV